MDPAKTYSNGIRNNLYISKTERPKQVGLAQWQRVGFQTQTLGIQFPPPSLSKFRPTTVYKDSPAEVTYQTL